MTVVMAIISILLIIGAPALVSARYQFMVDSVTEDIISTIRIAQNNAISIKGGSSCTDAKVWGVKIESNDYVLAHVCPDPPPAPLSTETSATSTKPYPAVTIGTNAYVYFTAPFGEARLFTVAPVGTTWSEDASRIEQSYTNSAFPTLLPQNISVSYRGRTRTVTINPNGDVVGN